MTSYKSRPSERGTAALRVMFNALEIHRLYTLRCAVGPRKRFRRLPTGLDHDSSFDDIPFPASSRCRRAAHHPYWFTAESTAAAAVSVRTSGGRWNQPPSVGGHRWLDA